MRHSFASDLLVGGADLQQCAGNARSFQPFDHADLHAPFSRALEAGPATSPSSFGKDDERIPAVCHLSWARISGEGEATR